MSKVPFGTLAIGDTFTHREVLYRKSAVCMAVRVHSTNSPAAWFEAPFLVKEVSFVEESSPAQLRHVALLREAEQRGYGIC